MIETCEGKGVGAGKSFYVAGRMLEHIAKGGTVFASDSFELKWGDEWGGEKAPARQLIRDRWGVEPHADQYQTFPETDVKRLHEVTPQGTDECPVLLVIDEAHTQLNARDWADRDKRPLFDWLTQSRHDNNDVLFITQNAHNLDKQIARLVTYIRRCRNMANFGGVWPLKQFVVSTLDADGKTCFGRRWYWHDQAIFGAYVSKSQKGKHKRLGVTIPPRKLTKVKANSKNMKFLLLLIPVLLIYMGFRTYNRFSSAKNKTAPAGEATQPANKTAPAEVGGRVKPKQVRAELVSTMGGWSYSERAADGIMKNYREPRVAVTSEGVFMEGELSAFGMVREIRTPSPYAYLAIIRCVDVDAVTFVTADRKELPPEVAVAKAAPVVAAAHK